MSRRVEGAALLVAGHGAIGGTSLDVSAVHTLGQIGEALLATGSSWQIRRLSAQAGERYGADRGSIKHHVDELVAEPVRVAMLVVLGAIADTTGPALVTSSELRAYPEDATLPLAWIGDRLRAMKAQQLLVVMSGRRDPAFALSSGGKVGSWPRAWLGALGTSRVDHVIAVDAPDGGAPLVDALLAGLCGDALDPKTGTVTMKSVSEYLARSVPAAAIQLSSASQTLAPSPPLAGLWDVRRSQLSVATRTHTRTSSGEPEDLTSTVLPGRFRLDAIVARGTFGTVYRARQLAVERDVAVKVLHASIDPASEDGRLFVQEIRAVGRMDHANVVRIHQADITHDGRLFYAMELLDGRDLQQLGEVPKERAVALVRQLLAGLGAAHDAGLVHADVKPANAIVVPTGEDSERVVLVDFGLARLRAPDRSTESVGGTPAYMAPEQLNEGRVDARSDLFSAALVLVTLLTGWRRPNATWLVPPLDTIGDAELREVLARALELDPAKRYQTASELAAALIGKSAAPQASQAVPVLPFRLFAPLTESDRGRLYGREADLAVLIEHVLYRRSVIYTAPSGTGKTSLLRAGLAPRLDALGVHVVYWRARNSSEAELAEKIEAGATTIADAVARHHERGGKLVLVIDQVEAAEELVGAVLGFARWPADVDVAVVLSVREDHLARLLSRAQQLEPGIPIVRLRPLGAEGARAAIVGPLAEARLAIEPELLDALLADLQRAAAAIAPEMGWDGAPAVYPPHLQLACSILFEGLSSGEATLTLAHYKKLGGFDAIVGEHLERVLDVEIADGRDVIARDIFLALVTSGSESMTLGAHERAMRPETELVAMVGAIHGAEHVLPVLELLRARGLLVRVRGEPEPSWELVHDSLVPRVLAWIDRRDLARRRAVELVRYHVRRSTPRAPSLLGRDELRELRAYEDAIGELDAEYRERQGWMPSRLVEVSREVLRRRTLAYTGLVAAALALATGAILRNRIAAADKLVEDSLRDRDLGRFTLVLEPFDWDPVALRALPTSLPAPLTWELHDPDPSDPDSPGAVFDDSHLVRGDGTHIEARGGHAFLVIDGRGHAGEHCAPSIVPIAQLPGYAQRNDTPPMFHVRVPTCSATSADTVAIPVGPFIYGGAGDPPTPMVAEYPEIAHEERLELPAFRIDRTEVTNAAFAELADLAPLTGIQPPMRPRIAAFEHAGEPDRPVTHLTWIEARAYCRYIGKELVTSEQWERALRGGEHLPDGTTNPMPRRSLPWGPPTTSAQAKFSDTGSDGPAAVGSFPGDRSPEGVLDLAGNVTEWTDSPVRDKSPGIRVVRGGNWGETSTKNLLDWVAIHNQRPMASREGVLGMRCAYVARPGDEQGAAQTDGAPGE